MSAMRVRALLRRSRHRVALALVVLGLVGAIVVHHGMPAGMAMDHGHPEHAVATCFGVLAAAVVVVGAVLVVARRRPRRRRARPALPRLVHALARRRPPVRARAGPPVPLVLHLGVLRR
jgi:hypothetical protein